MHKNRSVNVHQFAMTPRAEIPRSTMRRQHAHKTTFDAGYLVPIYADEVLPGDTFNLRMTAFARMATPLFPIMDNAYVDTFFFFVPNRLLWDNWQRFMGEQINPGDTTDFLIPQVSSPVGGYAACSLFDYFGLPTVGQVNADGVVTHSALWLRAYNLIWNEWFRDENLQDTLPVSRDDGPDLYSDYSLVRRGKRHDYFTSCLPWPQKGNDVTLPIVDGNAPVTLPAGNTVGVDVFGSGFPLALTNTSSNPGATLPSAEAYLASGASAAGSDTPLVGSYDSSTGSWGGPARPGGAANAGEFSGSVFVGVPTRGQVASSGSNASATGLTGYISQSQLTAGGLYADLSVVAQVTINALRMSFQVQRLLERDARGGTRYIEILRSHFGVVSPDSRLQRPEYLGGGSTPINITPVAQTSESSTSSPQGNLAAFGTFLARNHGFSQSFVEHGVIIGLASIRADYTYPQGLHRMWSRRSRFDFYFPVFAHLGEQAVLNKEIYFQGSDVENTPHDDDVFGYQERWAEYRYKPSQMTGFMRPTTTGSLDAWHYAQVFDSCPTLSDEFIQERPPINRVVAAGDQATGQQFLVDMFFNCVTARPMPLYSVPGMIDHF